MIVKEQKPKVSNDIVSDRDLTILFTTSIIVVAGIWIYLARNAIFKKKDEYENKEGLIHISELSFDHVEKVDDVVSVGKEVKAKIIKLIFL